MINVIGAIKTVDSLLNIAKPILDLTTKNLLPEMKAFAERLYELSSKYPSLEAWAQGIGKCAEVFEDILYVLGVKCDKSDIIGFKANQAEKQMSEFETIEEYINYLGTEVELNEEKFKALSPEEKMGYTTAGIAVAAGAVGEKLGIQLSPDFAMLLSKISSIASMVVNTVEIIDIIKGIKSSNVERVDDICDYFKGEGKVENRVNAGLAIKDIFATVFKDKPIEDVIENIKMASREK